MTGLSSPGTAPLFHATFGNASKRRRRSKHAQPKVARSRSLLRGNCSGASSVAASTNSPSTTDPLTPIFHKNIEPSTEPTLLELRSPLAAQSPEKQLYEVAGSDGLKPSKWSPSVHLLSRPIQQGEEIAKEGVIISDSGQHQQQNMSSAQNAFSDPNTTGSGCGTASSDAAAIQRRKMERTSRLIRKQQEAIDLNKIRMLDWSKVQQQHEQRAACATRTDTAEVKSATRKTSPLQAAAFTSTQTSNHASRDRKSATQPVPYSTKALEPKIVELSSDEEFAPHPVPRRSRALKPKTIELSSDDSSTERESVSAASTSKRKGNVVGQITPQTGPGRLSDAAASSMTSLDSLVDRPDKIFQASEVLTSISKNDTANAVICFGELMDGSGKPAERGAMARPQIQTREISSTTGKRRAPSKESYLSTSQPRPPKRTRIDEKVNHQGIGEGHNHPAPVNAKGHSTTAQDSSKTQTGNPETALAPMSKLKTSAVLANSGNSEKHTTTEQCASGRVLAQEIDHSAISANRGLFEVVARKKTSDSGTGTKNQLEVLLSKKKKIAELEIPAIVKKPIQSLNKHEVLNGDSTTKKSVQKAAHLEKAKKVPERAKKGKTNHDIAKFKRDVRRTQKNRLQPGPFIEDSDDATIDASDAEENLSGSDNSTGDSKRNKPAAHAESPDDGNSLFVQADPIPRSSTNRTFDATLSNPRLPPITTPKPTARSKFQGTSITVPRDYTSHRGRQTSSVASTRAKIPSRAPEVLKGAERTSGSGTSRNIKSLESRPASHRQPGSIEIHRPAPSLKTPSQAKKAQTLSAHSDVFPKPKSSGSRKDAETSAPDSKRSQAGKQINHEAVRAYYNSLEQEQQLLGRRRSVDASCRAADERSAPSSTFEEDEIHYVYSVMRMQWADESDEAKAEWVEVSLSPYYDLERANRAAQVEITYLRDGLVLDPSCNYSSELDEDGMRYIIVSGSRGIIHVKVTRRLQTRGCGKVPTTRLGWVSKRIYSITLLSGRVVPQTERDTSADEACSESEGDEEEHVEMQELQTYPHGAYTILDQANRLAARWLLDTVYGKSARIDDVSSRFGHERSLEDHCISLAAARQTLDVSLDAETDGQVSRRRVKVEEVKLNGPWNF